MIKFILRKQAYQIIISLFLYFSLSFVSIYSMKFFGDIINIIIKLASVTDIKERRALFDDVLYLTGLIILSVFLLSFVIFLFLNWEDFIKIRTKRIVSKRLLSELNKLDTDIFEGEYPYDRVFSILHNDLEQTIAGIWDNLNVLLRSSSGIVASLIFFTTQHWLIAVIILSVTLFTQPTTLFFINSLRKRQSHLSDSNREYSKIMQECLTSYNTLYFSGRKHLLFSLTEEASSKQIKSLFSRNRFNSLVNFFGDFMTDLCALIIELTVIFLLIYKYLPGILNFGLFFTITFLQGTFSNYFHSVFNSISGIRSLSEVKNKLTINLPLTSKQGLSIKELETLELNAVGMTIGEKRLFDNLNIKLEKGKRYAIVGSSGSGKTTLLRIILGLERNYVGNIKINGEDYRDLSLESLRSIFSYSPADTHIFDTSIANNITLWEGGDTTPVLKQVDLSDEITGVKGDGANALELSVGQKQRVGLARTFFLDRQVIVLDESLASVDRKKTSIIKDNISKIKGKTIIFVSHHIEKNDTFFDEIIDLEDILVKQE